MLALAYGIAPTAWAYGYLGICATAYLHYGTWGVAVIFAPALKTPWPEFLFVSLPELAIVFGSGAALITIAVLSYARWTRWEAIFWAAPSLATSLGTLIASFSMFDRASP